MTLKPAGPRLPRDKVLELLSDACYHSAHELANLSDLKPGQWYIALQELIEHGYTFARRGNSILLELGRRLPSKRPAQDLQVLLKGIDATRPDFGVRAIVQAPRRHGEGNKVIERPIEPELPKGVVADNALKISEEPSTWQPAKVSITSTRAVLAKKSAGKTYLAMVIAEEYLRIRMQTGAPMAFIVFDPTGVWYGLGALPDGSPSALKVIRLGGKYGNFPLLPEDGNKVAELVMKLWPESFVLDVSDMLPEEQHQFFADFGNRLYTGNERPVHFFIDEADEVIPQQADSGNKVQRRALGVGDRLVRRGRVKGVGITLITQRPAVLNKNALSQVDAIYVLLVTAPHDLDAIDTWMKPAIAVTADRQTVLEELPKLGLGEVFLVQAHLRAGSLTKLMVRKKVTFDSSRTPTVDEPDPPDPHLASVDDEILARVAEILGIKPNVIKMVAPSPPPRYDKVWEDGTADLDAVASGEEVEGLDDDDFEREDPRGPFPENPDEPEDD